MKAVGGYSSSFFSLYVNLLLTTSLLLLRNNDLQVVPGQSVIGVYPQGVLEMNDGFPVLP